MVTAAVTAVPEVLMALRGQTVLRLIRPFMVALTRAALEARRALACPVTQTSLGLSQELVMEHSHEG